MNLTLVPPAVGPTTRRACSMAYVELVFSTQSKRLSQSGRRCTIVYRVRVLFHAGIFYWEFSIYKDPFLIYTINNRCAGPLPLFIDAASCWRQPSPPAFPLASGSQRMPNVGAIGFALTVVAYLYYSLWVLLTPFVEKDVVWFHNLFPDTWWALAVPTALLVLGVTCVITFVGILGRW